MLPQNITDKLRDDHLKNRENDIAFQFEIILYYLCLFFGLAVDFMTITCCLKLADELPVEQVAVKSQEMVHSAGGASWI